jgi:hypothetical protein
MVDYRKIFKCYYGCYPEGCEIHHLDHDRTNNNISNLVCLTSDLHKEYHSIYMSIGNESYFDISPKNATHLFSGGVYGLIGSYLMILSRIVSIKRDQDQAIKCPDMKRYISYE